MKYLFLTFLLCSPSFADPGRWGVDWDHGGTSFALTTITYGGVKAIASTAPGPNNRLTDVLTAATISLFISTSYSLATAPQGSPGHIWPYPGDKNKLLWNFIGAGLSSVTTLVFEF